MELGVQYVFALLLAQLEFLSYLRVKSRNTAKSEFLKFRVFSLTKSHLKCFYFSDVQYLKDNIHLEESFLII